MKEQKRTPKCVWHLHVVRPVVYSFSKAREIQAKMGQE